MLKVTRNDLYVVFISFSKTNLVLFNYSSIVYEIYYFYKNASNNYGRISSKEFMRFSILFFSVFLASSAHAGLYISVDRSQTTFNTPGASAVFTNASRTTPFSNLSYKYDQSDFGGELGYYFSSLGILAKVGQKKTGGLTTTFGSNSFSGVASTNLKGQAFGLAGAVTVSSRLVNDYQRKDQNISLAKVYKTGIFTLVPRIKVESNKQDSISKLDEYATQTTSISGINVNMTSEAMYYGLGLDLKFDMLGLMISVGGDYGYKSSDASLLASRCQDGTATGLDSTCTLAESGHTNSLDKSDTQLSYELGVGYKLTSFFIVEGFYNVVKDPHFLSYSYTYVSGRGLEVSLSEVDIKTMGLRAVLAF